MNAPPLPTPPTSAQPPQRRGCVFYGCLTAAILGVVGLVAIYFGFRFVMSAANKLVEDYTDIAPMKVQRVEMPTDELKVLQERLTAFGQAMEKQDQSQELILTANDLNGLIGSAEQGGKLRDRLFVRIEGDQVQGDISIPLEDIGPLKLKGRYLNGLGAFRVSLTNGTLDVRLDRVEVNGKVLPQEILRELKKKNLTRDFQPDEDTDKVLRQLESLTVSGGKIILRNKTRQP